MSRLVTRTVLAGPGALLGLIGGALMLAPKTFLEMSGVFIRSDPGVMSELTAPSGVLLVTSTIMILGAVKIRFADLALSIGAIVYGSYGVGRLVSMGLHGLPSESLIIATVIELGLAAGLAALKLTGISPRQHQIAEAHNFRAIARPEKKSIRFAYKTNARGQEIAPDQPSQFSQSNNGI